MNRRRRISRSIAIGLLSCFTAGTSLAEEAQPLSESQAVTMTVSHHPTLQTALVELESARWAVVGEEARYALTLKLDSGVTHTENPTLSPNGTLVSQSNTISLGAELDKHLVWGTDLSLRLDGNWQQSHSPFGGTQVYALGPGYGVGLKFSITQPLLRGLGRDVSEAELQAAQVRRTSAERSRDRTASELIQKTVNAYWELWYASRALSIEEQSLELARRERAEAAARAKTGSLAPADVLSFETRVATREENVSNAELTVAQRRVTLAQAMGQAGGVEAWSPVDDPELPPLPPANAAALAEESSSAIAEAKVAIELAEVQARAAADPLRPKLDLNAYAEARGLGDKDAAAALGQMASFGAVSAHVGLSFEAPLDDSRHRAARAQALLAVERARKQLEELRQSVIGQVAVELGSDEAARRRLALAEQTARTAERQLEAEQARFATGSSTPLAVLTAEDDVRSARLRAARARVDVLAASISIAHLTGRLLATYKPRLDRATALGANGARRSLGLAGPKMLF